MKKIGFVLEGGGARGAYQAGALKALSENNITPNVITGTSIGALNGALFAMGKLERLLELYSDFHMELFFKFDQEVIKEFDLGSATLKDFSQLTWAMFQVMLQGGVNIDPFKNMIENEIDEKELRSSEIKLGMVTLGIPKIHPLEVYLDQIPAGKVHEYLLASAYLPIFKAEERRYVDGWFVDNAPLELLMKKGPFDEIYIIRSHSGGITRSAWNNEGITLITPSREVGRTFDLSPDKMQDNLLMGYYDTLGILKGYQGKKYYFRELPNLKETLLTPEVLKQLSKQFSMMDHYDYERYFYEELLPGLARALGLGVESNYQDVLLELLETGGYYLKINPNELYDLSIYLEKLRMALREKNIEWNIREKVFGGVARYTRGWFGDLEILVLAFLDLMVNSQGR
ncbi:MAG: patatin-like phospholipase family protein [Tissierellia bacterium]|nr:patatin-like phospholipase family protein [Tissierellia bacterium]